MRTILVREFSTRDDWQVVLASALGRQLPVAVLASIVGFIVIATTRGFERDAVLIALALAPLPILATGDNLRALFEATGRVRLIVTAGLVAIGVTSLVRIVAVVADAPIWVFAAAARAAFSQFRRDVATDLLKESWPLLVSGFAVLLYMRADILMLGLLADDEVTGIYTAAARFSELWYFLPVAAMAAVRPRLARLYAEAEDVGYRITTQRFMAVSYGVSLGAIVITLVVGSFLIEAVYGASFSAASEVLRIHVLAAPFVFLGTAASQWFIDRGMTRAVMLRSALGASINIVLNLILIPTQGAVGAAIATLVSYSLASVFINAFFPDAREVFWMQIRALWFARQ
jgi:PST family polysaccharide transporter